MWRCAAVLVGALAVAAAMGQKLHGKAILKGWLPGAIVTHEVIVQKGYEPARRLRDDDYYWVSWGEGNLAGNYFDRQRVTPEAWRTINVGDRVEVRYLPGSKEPFLRDSIYVDSGNIAFDVCVIAAALLVAAYFAAGICWRLFRQGTLDAEPLAEVPPTSGGRITRR